MTHLVTVEALGVHVGIEAPDPALAADLEEAWSACLSPGTEPLAATVAPEAASREELLETVTQHVTVAAVGERAGELLMLHACAVADEATRRAVVLVGRSGVGKSTLARALGRQLTYLSDETAAVDHRGRVLAYPKPLSLIEVVGSPKRQISPEALGLRSGSGWYDVVAVALLDRAPGECPDATPVPMIPAIAMLAEHTSYLASLDRPLERLAELLRRAGGLHALRYAEAAQLKDVVAGWLS